MQSSNFSPEVTLSADPPWARNTRAGLWKQYRAGDLEFDILTALKEWYRGMRVKSQTAQDLTNGSEERLAELGAYWGKRFVEIALQIEVRRIHFDVWTRVSIFAWDSHR
jgi:hypothetical protein